MICNGVINKWNWMHYLKGCLSRKTSKRVIVLSYGMLRAIELSCWNKGENNALWHKKLRRGEK